jgi:hypothetical protein
MMCLSRENSAAEGGKWLFTQRLQKYNIAKGLIIVRHEASECGFQRFQFFKKCLNGGGQGFVGFPGRLCAFAGQEQLFRFKDALPQLLQVDFFADQDGAVFVHMLDDREQLRVFLNDLLKPVLEDMNLFPVKIEFRQPLQVVPVLNIL